MVKIDQRAVVEEGAILGADVEIGPYAFVSKNAKIRDRVKIMQGAQIHGDVQMGEDCDIYPYAIIGTPPQDSGYKLEDDVKVIIGANNKIREFVTINMGTKKGGGITKIGDNCFLMTYVHVAHDCQIGDNVIMANNATLAGHVEVGSFTVIGGMTPIHQFVKIGEGVMIGGASAVSQDIPHFCLAEGNRAKILGLNLVGLRRRFERDEVEEVKSAFRLLFRKSETPIKESAAELFEKTDNQNIKKLCDFIINSKRGVPFERKNANG